MLLGGIGVCDPPRVLRALRDLLGRSGQDVNVVSGVECVHAGPLMVALRCRNDIEASKLMKVLTACRRRDRLRSSLAEIPLMENVETMPTFLAWSSCSHLIRRRLADLRSVELRHSCEETLTEEEWREALRECDVHLAGYSAREESGGFARWCLVGKPQELAAACEKLAANSGITAPEMGRSRNFGPTSSSSSDGRRSWAQVVAQGDDDQNETK